MRLKVVGGVVVVGVATALFGCGCDTTPLPIVISVAGLEQIINDNLVDATDNQRTISGVEISVENGEIEGIYWDQGGSSLGSTVYDASSETLTLEGVPDYGNLDLLIKAISNTDSTEGRVEGLTFGPDGSNFVVSKENFASFYGKLFSELQENRSVGEGGYPIFFVRNYMFENLSQAIQNFAQGEIEAIGYEDAADDNDVVAFETGNRIFGFRYMSAEEQIEFCPEDSNLKDYFTNLPDFEAQYGNMGALTPGFGGLVDEYLGLDVDGVDGDDLDEMFEGVTFFEDLVSRALEFMYGKSDETSDWLVFARDDSENYTVYGITQEQYEQMDAENPFNQL